mgnify:CR=1 FL=1
MAVLENAKHELFAQELAKGKTATEAYVLAGYKDNDGNASKLAAKVQDRVKEITGKAADKAGVTIERILAELAKIGFANMLDYVTINGSGEPVIDLSELSREQAAAIQEVIVDTHNEREGEESVSVRRVRFKLLDKRAALVDMGKHLGMFKERVEHSGPNGGPIETKDVSARDILSSRIAGLAARTRTGEGSGGPDGKPS